jgi:hypothetical protein
MPKDLFKRTIDIAYYILFQRTQYRHQFHNNVRNYNRLRLYRNYFLRIDGIIRKNFIAKLYFMDIKADFGIVQKYLIQKIENILDIGCRMGGINILINRHYSKVSAPFFTVLDKDVFKNIELIKTYQ